MTTILRSLHRGFHFSSSKLSKASNLAEEVIVILNWLILFIEKVIRSLQKVPFGLQSFYFGLTTDSSISNEMFI